MESPIYKAAHISQTYTGVPLNRRWEKRIVKGKDKNLGGVIPPVALKNGEAATRDEMGLCSWL